MTRSEKGASGDDDPGAAYAGVGDNTAAPLHGAVTVLAPVRYPLTEKSKNTVRRAIEIVEERPETHLVVLHVNLLQRGDHVTRADLRQTVKRDFGNVDADYRVRDGVMLEEALIDEAARSNADVVVIGEDDENRLLESIQRILGADADLESALREQLDVEVEVSAS